MAMDFSKFKKNKQKLDKAISQMKTEKQSYEDSRMWVPKKDKAGNGEAIIRFLPQQDTGKPPIVKWFQHFFKERGQWFFEKCPSTLGKDCKICDYVKPIWDDDEDLAFKYSRSASFIANVLIVKDPSNSENDGKVMLFKFGKKIFDKIMDKVAPESELDEPLNVLDLWDGCNFKFKVKKVAGYPNYDSCEFYGKQTPVADDDDAIEKIYNQLYDLDEFVAEKEFKDTDVAYKKFLKVIGKAGKNSSSDEKESDKEDSVNDAFDEENDSSVDSKQNEPKPDPIDDEDDFEFDDDDAF